MARDFKYQRSAAPKSRFSPGMMPNCGSAHQTEKIVWIAQPVSILPPAARTALARVPSNACRGERCGAWGRPASYEIVNEKVMRGPKLLSHRFLPNVLCAPQPSTLIDPFMCLSRNNPQMLLRDSGLRFGVDSENNGVGRPT